MATYRRKIWQHTDGRYGNMQTEDMARGRRKIWQEADTRNGSRSHIMTVHNNPTTWARGGVSQANKRNKPNKKADLTRATVGKLAAVSGSVGEWQLLHTGGSASSTTTCQNRPGKIKQTTPPPLPPSPP